MAVLDRRGGDPRLERVAGLQHRTGLDPGALLASAAAFDLAGGARNSSRLGHVRAFLPASLEITWPAANGQQGRAGPTRPPRATVSADPRPAGSLSPRPSGRGPCSRTRRSARREVVSPARRRGRDKPGLRFDVFHRGGRGGRTVSGATFGDASRSGY